MELSDPVIRGLFALLVAFVLFVLAKLRFRERGDQGAPADSGLD